MHDGRTLGERVSDVIAQFGGSWRFIFAALVFLLAWIIVNTLAAFEVIAFDKYPYILLNLVLSFVAAFQAPFIMMSQNRAEKKQDEAYRILFREIKDLVEEDLRTEQEIRNLEQEISSELLLIKTQQIKMLEQILNKLED